MTSTVPAVLTALTGLWGGLGITVTTPRNTAQLQVIDGPGYDVTDYFLCVGWDAPDQPAVEGTSSMADYGQDEDREQYDVPSMLAFYYDAGDVTTVRGLMFAVYEQVRAALKADHTLGGLVLNARVSRFRLTQDLDETGSRLGLLFVTNVDAMAR